MAENVKTLRVLSGGVEAGRLEKGPQFVFRYKEGASSQEAVSLIMPPVNTGIASNILHPVFEMNLPEGYLRQRITERFRKYADVDDMFFLALQGESSIGRLGFSSDAISREGVSGVTLAELVSSRTPDLFERLVDEYIGQTTIAGVQPKILVPEDVDGKSALQLPELIVKTSGDEFPNLSINEFVCMSIAAKAGLTVPEFHLSKDHRLFIMRRFDITSDNRRLGMEDVCGLMGRTTDKKYRSSYEQIAKAVAIYSNDTNRDLAVFFRSLCITVLVGNGDAHLKNFAFLYDDPATGQGWLSPAYDIVNTSVYLHGDPLALKLMKSRDYPNRDTMTRFGNEYCNLTKKQAIRIIDECIEAARLGLEEHGELAKKVEFAGRTLEEELKHARGRLMTPDRKSLVWKGKVRKPKRVR